MMRAGILVLAAAALALGVVPLGAQTLDDQVLAIAARLRCPVCQNESVADSPSELAEQMRSLIRARLERGDPPDTIIAYFVGTYGEWILLDPPRRGVTGWLWGASSAVILGALLVAAGFIRRAIRVPATTPAEPR